MSAVITETLLYMFTFYLGQDFINLQQNGRDDSEESLQNWGEKKEMIHLNVI